MRVHVRVCLLPWLLSPHWLQGTQGSHVSPVSAGDVMKECRKVCTAGIFRIYTL